MVHIWFVFAELQSAMANPALAHLHLRLAVTQQSYNLGCMRFRHKTAIDAASQ